MDQFKIEPYSGIDKSVTIIGPEELVLSVDFDDVNHEVIERLMKEVVEHLNKKRFFPHNEDRGYDPDGCKAEAEDRGEEWDGSGYPPE